MKVLLHLFGVKKRVLMSGDASMVGRSGLWKVRWINGGMIDGWRKVDFGETSEVARFP